MDATLAQPDGRSSGRSVSMLPLLTLPTMLDAFDPALWTREHPAGQYEASDRHDMSVVAG